jgi:hypothetical protein
VRDLNPGPQNNSLVQGHFNPDQTGTYEDEKIIFKSQRRSDKKITVIS